MAIGLQGYTKSPDGFGTGSYSTLHPKGVWYQLSRSLFEGNVLSITSTRKSLDPELHKARAIRLYDGATKVFDGYLRAPNYNRKPNLLRDLTAKAYNWDKELDSIYITESGNYTSKTIDFILADLCRIANEGGVVKKAEYKYDSSKLPYYSNEALNTAISPTFKDTIGSALKELTRLMDVLETYYTGDWVVKVDSLQSDNYIYLIPQMVLPTVTPARTLPDWKLQPPKNLGPDYSKLLNYVIVKGKNGLVSLTLGATPLLAATGITSNSFTANATTQPSARNYLKITVANTSASDKIGNIVINGGDGATPIPNELTERFFFKVPAGETKWHLTNNRYATLSTGALHSFEANSFLTTPNCTIKVDECLHGVAGRSVNDFGIRADTFPNDDFDTQEKCDSYAQQMVNKYHAPLVYCSSVLKPKFIDTTDYTGKTIRLYDDIAAANKDFVCLRQDLSWVGEQVTEAIEVMRYNYDWEYTE